MTEICVTEWHHDVAKRVTYFPLVYVIDRKPQHPVFDVVCTHLHRKSSHS